MQSSLGVGNPPNPDKIDTTEPTKIFDSMAGFWRKIGAKKIDGCSLIRRICTTK
jgi:hypothetical protein